MENDFVTWLENEMDARGWTNSETARRAGVSASNISMTLSRTKFPGVEMCRGLARAFHIPPERVFRIAGILPPRVIGSEKNHEELLDYYDALSERNRRALIAMA